MKDKGLRKLSRRDLLELLVEQSEKMERLEQQLADAQALINEREIALSKAGSIAEAALQLNQVFAAAEKAAAQYLENIERISGRQEEICAQRDALSRKQADQIVEQAKRRAAQLEADTRSRCEKIVELAGADVVRFRETFNANKQDAK